jgi:hypothetical protein
MDQDRTSRYSFIFDNELFLNIGRLIGVGILLGIAYFTSQTTALIYGSVAIAVIHLLLVVIFLVTQKRKLLIRLNSF